MVIMPKWTREGIDALLHQIVDGSADGRKDLKRQRIIEAASKLFIEQGYRKTSLDEIARAAGVAKGTVYLYAKSKAELLMQALAAEKLKQSHVIDHVMDPTASALERLRRYIEIAFVGTVRIPLYSKVLAGDVDVMMALAEVSPVDAADKKHLDTAFLNSCCKKSHPKCQRENVRIAPSHC